jgi:hypothetical protein
MTVFHKSALHERSNGVEGSRVETIHPRLMDDVISLNDADFINRNIFRKTIKICNETQKPAPMAEANQANGLINKLSLIYIIMER